VLIFKVANGLSCSFDHVIQLGLVFRMHSTADEFKRNRRSLFNLENTINLLRPRDLVRFDAPGKTAGSAESLAFREKTFTPKELFLGMFAIINVGAGAVPPHDLARPVAEWLGANKEPSISAIMAAKTRLNLIGLS
jgi:hypothetical protein